MVPIWPGFRQYDGLQVIVEGVTVGDDFHIRESQEFKLSTLDSGLSSLDF